MRRTASRINLVVCWWCYIFVVLFQKNVDAVMASRGHCKLSDDDIVTLTFDAETNSYKLLDRQDVTVDSSSSPVPPPDSGGRYLQPREHVRKGSSKEANLDYYVYLTDVETVKAFQLSREYFDLDHHHPHHRSLVLSANPPETVRARHCYCADARNYPDYMYFCPLDKEYCVFQRSFEEVPPEPSCVNETRRRSVAKTVWPVAVVWYTLILIFLLFTVHGHNAFDCCISFIFPCWNNIVAQNIMRRNPTRATIMMRRWHGRYRENVEQLFGREQFHPTERVPTRLKLKTTIYSRSDHNRVGILGPKLALNMMSGNDDIVDGHSCAICFAQLEDGDRVGLLPCQHIFHVACLKTWLKRRNVCPLCLRSNVAEPCFETPSED